MKRIHRIQVFSVLAALALAAFLFYRPIRGEDLSSSYFGCKVLAAGEPGHLYSHDPSSFDILRDPVWQNLEDQTLFKHGGIVHPYVQTPLWAYSIRPLCSNTTYPVFHGIFLALECACFAALVWIVAAAWTPALLRPGWIALAAVLLFASVPVRYALLLAQTHIVFLLMTVLAIALARRYPVAAGALLALAAAVKITPAYLAIYWLLTRRTKAALSFVACSAGLVLLTVLTTGWGLFVVYLHNLSETSNVLLVAYNNQSLSAWLMGHRFSPAEFDAWHAFPLPVSLKIASLILALSATVIGSVLDRRSPAGPPYGAIFTLIACTLFAPIAWSHYFFLLLIPCMMVLDSLRRQRSLPMLALLSIVLVLNLVPRVVMHDRLHMLRPQFYAAILSLAGLVVLALKQSKVSRQDRLADGLPAAA